MSIVKYFKIQKMVYPPLPIDRIKSKIKDYIDNKEYEKALKETEIFLRELDSIYDGKENVLYFDAYKFFEKIYTNLNEPEKAKEYREKYLKYDNRKKKSFKKVVKIGLIILALLFILKFLFIDIANISTLKHDTLNYVTVKDLYYADNIKTPLYVDLKGFIVSDYTVFYFNNYAHQSSTYKYYYYILTDSSREVPSLVKVIMRCDYPDVFNLPDKNTKRFITYQPFEQKGYVRVESSIDIQNDYYSDKYARFIFHPKKERDKLNFANTVYVFEPSSQNPKSTISNIIFGDIISFIVVGGLLIFILAMFARY